MYFISHWNLVFTSVFLMRYLWLCLGINCKGMSSYLFLIFNCKKILLKPLPHIHEPSQKFSVDKKNKILWKSAKVFAKWLRSHIHCGWSKTAGLRLIRWFYWTFPGTLITTSSLALWERWFGWRKVVEIGEIGTSYIFFSWKLSSKISTTLKHKPQVKVQMRLLYL